ncbi:MULTISPECIES: DUF192 domain-containing protein [unclassified Ruegeria]|uniref:DUF192 domain-containing protein n=1 Tax=unclassified Ruegeria TaxID=2625375 RepID=UPI00148986BB|nr:MULTISPECIES: DUF192 domain-containing protein [unclassified Ruegeria]NOD33964.1 DUF192 domain-containing protein [Ruegeria sp. HKCCD7296]NOD46345.1 DUF192 domain-containing protein [Ruegeria sp. HKCCD5849]NOD50355.1 DUF192 domain-containing protein [Ruegeria sp. HKCCD5851]NOD67171.1 DUF192 domain-containing protein [Ruegeria sp. HKCCD7303]NOE40988.1 DUF192 domain-containing protein [Ruegeria sp. HKCCD7319]
MGRFLTLLTLFFTLWAGGAFAACRADQVSLRNDAATVRFDIELAVTPQERSRGLMFRESLPNRSGMLFVFDPPQPVAFWMKNTLIPLDMIFVDRTGTVTRVHEGAIPGDLTPIEGGDSVFAVLEINAGLSARYSITPGTQMQHEIFSQGPAIWPC